MHGEAGRACIVSATTGLPVAWRNRQRGMTLIELLVVIVLIAILSASSGMALGAIGRTRLRSACSMLVTWSGSAYHHAIAKGMTVRLVLDFKTNKMSVQQARAGIVLAKRDAAAQRDEPEGEAAIDPWERARRRLQTKSYEKPSAPLSPWEPLQSSDGKVWRRFQQRSLGQGIRILKVWVPHETAVQTSGQAALHFFPGGMGEHAVVQLADASDHVFSVEIQSLTGRGKVYDYAYEPDDLEDEAGGLRDSG